MPVSPHDEFFAAFRDDHAALGRGFYELSTRLQARDLAGAKSLAERLQRDAGAHIAFEETTLYPALRPLLGDDAVSHLNGDHDVGLGVVCELENSPIEAGMPAARFDDLLQRARQMETHIAECGQLFGALGGLPPRRRETLHQALLRWRERAPTWSEATRHRPAPG
jgi:hypothetical protein